MTSYPLVRILILIAMLIGAYLQFEAVMNLIVRARAERLGWPRHQGFFPPRWILRQNEEYYGEPWLGLFALLPKRFWRRLPAYEEAALLPLLNAPNPLETLVRTLTLLWVLDREHRPEQHRRTSRLIRWRMRGWEEALGRLEDEKVQAEQNDDPQMTTEI